jgi:hypothetical protein
MSKRFPITVVDNFYNNPDDIVQFVVSQKFEKTQKGGFQGKRTQGLHTLNRNMFDYFCSKLFSLFYDKQPNMKWKVVTNFDLIEQKTKSVGTGWIHQDNNKHLLAGLIYLNKNWQESVGTNLYEKVKDVDEHLSQTKTDYFLDNTDLDKYLKDKQINNSSFDKTGSIEPVYNRMVCYDASYFHAIGDISNLKTDRLVQVFFVEELKVDSFPLERI